MNVARLTDQKLNTLLLAIRQELRTRTLAGAEDPLVMVKGQEAAKRAILVAAVQKHAVLMFGPPGCGKTMLAVVCARLEVPAIEMRPCPCGNYTDPRRPCRCTPYQVRRHLDKHERLFAKVDIHIEVPPVPLRQLNSSYPGTSLAQVQKQLAGATEIRQEHVAEAINYRRLDRRSI